MQDQKITTIEGYPFICYQQESYPEQQMLERSKDFYSWLDTRRSVREFSDRPVPKEVIENILKAASSAPSGAHKQPWTFCLISNAVLKKQIREAAEKEEWENYHSRMTPEWLQDLAPFGTDWKKPFLEKAPYLIVVFKKIFELNTENATKRNNYYVTESVGLACGFLLAAIHYAGLAALTHTPSPMNFLTAILQRPANERPFLLIPVGYAAEQTYVPHITRKALTEVVVYYE
jgi:nitroreductase